MIQQPYLLKHLKIHNHISLDILDIEEKEGQFTVKGIDFTETFDKKDYLQMNCAICGHRNPVEYDEMVADPVEEMQCVEPYGGVKEIEEMDSERKWIFFSRLISSCIRCSI